MDKKGLTLKKQQFFVTGYVGEGAKRMLLDLSGMENVNLIEQVIENRIMRFLYYRCDTITDGFRKLHFLKQLFYPWFSVLSNCYEKNAENNIVFLNSGFCRELDIKVVNRLKKKNRRIKLILYIVDPMVGFNASEYKEIIDKMDLVYSINKEDCAKYGFCYYPLVYSREKKDIQKRGEGKAVISDLYYLGSGTDRTEVLEKIYQKCREEGLVPDFHVLCDKEEKAEHGITYHKTVVPYFENIRRLQNSNCILEVMHEEFDNPTQRYSEAVVYNKKLLTNNSKITAFDFYDPKYMRIFQSVEDIDTEFIKKEEEVDYRYGEEFSPKFLIQDIINRGNVNKGKTSEALDK